MKKSILLLLLFSFFVSYSQKVVTMQLENGVYYVPCKVNGVSMKFIFDTGASDVSISLTEAMFLLKQGVLKDDDLKGTIKHKIANGEVQEGTKIIIREINIDGIIINNVEASITHNLNAPLLLGQSAISKLGKIQLDGNKLIINSNSTFDNASSKFINIDFNKNLKSYFDEREIEMPDINTMTLKFKTSSLIKNNTHFLSKYKFDIESAEFDKEGKLLTILLLKESNDLDNEFKKVVNDVVVKYGNFSTGNDRIIIWKKKNYEITVVKGEEGYLSVFCDRKRENNIFNSVLYKAKQGDVISQYDLAMFYKLGKNVDKDYNKYIYWLKQSAKEYDKAQLELGMVEFKNKDNKKGFQWVFKSVSQGNSDAMATMALLYYNGQGTLKDYNKAFSWAKKSAKKNSPLGLYYLGFFYYYGIGTDINSKKSSELIKKSYLGGYEKAKAFWNEKELWKFE